MLETYELGWGACAAQGPSAGSVGQPWPLAHTPCLILGSVLTKTITGSAHPSHHDGLTCGERYKEVNLPGLASQGGEWRGCESQAGQCRGCKHQAEAGALFKAGGDAQERGYRVLFGKKFPGVEELPSQGNQQTSFTPRGPEPRNMTLMLGSLLSAFGLPLGSLTLGCTPQHRLSSVGSRLLKIQHLKPSPSISPPPAPSQSVVRLTALSCPSPSRALCPVLLLPSSVYISSDCSLCLPSARVIKAAVAARTHPFNGLLRDTSLLHYFIIYRMRVSCWGQQPHAGSCLLLPPRLAELLRSWGHQHKDPKAPDHKAVWPSLCLEI